jgi:hypothetical protein
MKVNCIVLYPYYVKCKHFTTYLHGIARHIISPWLTLSLATRHVISHDTSHHLPHGINVCYCTHDISYNLSHVLLWPITRYVMTYHKTDLITGHILSLITEHILSLITRHIFSHNIFTSLITPLTTQHILSLITRHILSLITQHILSLITQHILSLIILNGLVQFENRNIFKKSPLWISRG